MNRYPKHPRPFVHSPNYREAFQRLDESLARNCTDSNLEKIDRLRRAVFGELPEDNSSTVDELQKNEASPTVSCL